MKIKKIKKKVNKKQHTHTHTLTLKDTSNTSSKGLAPHKPHSPFIGNPCCICIVEVKAEEDSVCFFALNSSISAFLISYHTLYPPNIQRNKRITTGEIINEKSKHQHQQTRFIRSRNKTVSVQFVETTLIDRCIIENLLASGIQFSLDVGNGVDGLDVVEEVLFAVSGLEW